jgi:hypothetical protein
MSYMTKLPGAPDRDDIKPGMASWEGNGPKKKFCGTCLHRGYYKNDGHDFSPGCEMFYKLSGTHGPRVLMHWKACKYFEDGEKT